MCSTPGTWSPETCSTSGTWSPDTCSLGSSADVTSDDWRILTPGTWCSDTPSPDTCRRGSSADVTLDDWFMLEQHLLEIWPATDRSSTVPKQINLRKVDCSGATSIPIPVHAVASVCVRISGRAVSTKPKQVFLAVLPSRFFSPTQACLWCAQIGIQCPFKHHLSQSKVGKCDACIALGRECLFRWPVTHSLAVALSTTCINCQTNHKACQHNICGAELPACFRCLENDLGHMCFYKPVTQGGHSSKGCNRFLTQPESSGKTLLSKQYQPCHATPSLFPWT